MSSTAYDPKPEHKFSFGLWTVGHRGRDPFYDPVFRDGAFTANDRRVREYAVQKTMRAMDIGAELGAKIFVLWGGREGVETDGCRRPDHALKNLRESIDYLCSYSIDKK